MSLLTAESAVAEQYRELRAPRYVAAACGVAAVIIAAVPLAGLFAGNFVLASFRPGYKVIDPALALCMILLGGALLALALLRKSPSRPLQAVAWVVLVIACLRLAEIAVRKDWGTSDLFLSPPLLPQSPDESPISLPTTLALVAAGLWLLLTASRVRRLQAVIPAGITAIVGAAFLLGYIYGKPLLYGPGLLPLSLPGAISMTLLGVGMVLTTTTIDAAVRRLTEAELSAYRDHLETLVGERTAALEANQRRLRRLGAELATAEQRERQRLASAIHDEVAQMLSAIKLDLSKLRAEQSDQAVADKISGIIKMVEEATRQSRTIMMELSPPILQQSGLVQAVRWWAGVIREKHGLDVAVTSEGTLGRFDPDVEATAFQGVKELLQNTIKYARATQVGVNIACGGDRLQITVADDGVGFDPAAIEQSESGGFGLFGIRERVSYIAGSLVIDSAPGKGTRSTIALPVPCGAPPEGAGTQ